MRKTLLFMSLALGAFVSAAAQEPGEDVTAKYIINAGFDDDLTFLPDGTMKEAVSTTTSLSDRSWAYIAADSTLYARPKSDSSKSRPDGRKADAVNGFVARIAGWTVVPKSAFPACEWVYFGAVPYALGADAVPKSDDSNGFLTVPQKPAEFDTEDNTGFMFLSCGWTNACSYKQEVKLPTAQYRLEYWTINFNPNSTAEAKDLSNVKYRQITVRDEEGTGLSSQEWVKHEIEFVPVGSVTMEFGFESGNNTSNANPFVAIDGIRLIYLGEADAVEVLQGDFFEKQAVLEETIDNELIDYYGVADELHEKVQALSEQADKAEDAETLQALMAQLTEVEASIAEVKAAVEKINALIEKADNISNRTEVYPGYDVFTQTVQYIKDDLQNGTLEEVLASEQKLNEAIEAYFKSQEATMENPANYSYLVQHPWFSLDGREPASNLAADVAMAALADADKNADGWVDGSTASSKTTGAWFNVGRTCYQLWGTNFTGYLDVHQDLTNLPNGIYSVSADLITNQYALNDQHVYATSSLGHTEGFMTQAGVLDEWPNGTYEGGYPGDDSEPWETVTTESTVIVVDGKLTIGARSTNTNAIDDVSVGHRGGCFWITNFVLRYHGEATAEQIAEATKGLADRATNLIADMHFAADKAAAADSLAAYNASADLSKLNATIALAEASENKWAEIWGEGKTLPTVRDSLENYGDAAYGVAHDLVVYANQHTLAWVNAAEATYTKVDSVLNTMKGYTVTYANAYVEAAQALTEMRTEKGIKLVKELIDEQIAQLMADGLLLPADIDPMVAELKRTLEAAKVQDQYERNPNAKDYTAFIKNPDAASEEGWTLDKGTGDKNTTAGQHYLDDANRRYFDSYNSKDSVLNFYGEQRIEGLPNGTYTVRAAVRTNAPGAFLFTANGGAEKADTVFTEIPMQYYQTVTELGEDTTVVASDMYGAIWQEAMDAVMAGTETDEQRAIAYCNASSGRGWMWLTLPQAEVKNHVLVIGMTTDGNRTGKPFEGKWFSVTDWSLSLDALGDNSGWDGPISGVNAVSVATTVADAVYDLQGRRVSQPARGLYIVVRNGVARKVMMK